MNSLKNINYTSNIYNKERIQSILLNKTSILLNKHNSLNYKFNVCNLFNNCQHNFLSTNSKCNFKIENKLHSYNEHFHNYYLQYKCFSEVSNNNNQNLYNNSREQQEEYYQNEYTQDKKNLISDFIIHYLKTLIFLYFVHDCIFEISSVRTNNLYIYIFIFNNKNKSIYKYFLKIKFIKYI